MSRLLAGWRIPQKLGLLLTWPLSLCALCSVVWISTNGIVTHSDLPNRDSTCFVKRIDDHRVSLGEARGRRQMLLDVVVNFQSNAGTHQDAREDSRMQARGFLAVILAGLISVLIAKPVISRLWISWVAVVVTFAVYGLDVHISYLMSQEQIRAQQLWNTMEGLLKVDANDDHWYTLEFPNRNTGRGAEGKGTNETLNRIGRKLQLALAPTFEQIIYFLVPIALLLLFQMWTWVSGWGKT